MGKSCAVIDCSKKSPDKFGLYKVPKTPAKCNWLEFLSIANNQYMWAEAKCMYICSEHFERKFRNCNGSRIKKGGYPSVLNGEIVLPVPGVEINSEKEATHSLNRISREITQPLITHVEIDLNQTTLVSNLYAELEQKNAKIQEIESELNRINGQLQLSKYVIRKLKQKLKRKAKRKTTDIVTEKNSKCQKSSVIQQEFTPLPAKSEQLLQELLCRMFNTTGHPPYSKILREFAFQMHYYSPKAYRFLRESLSVLPHPRAFDRWTTHINASPEFLGCAFQYLSKINEESQKKLYFAMVLDEIHIRQQVIHEKDSFVGYCDYGGITENHANGKIASAALFIYLNCINGNHRLPIGYILTNGLQANVLAAVIRKSLVTLHEHGTNVLTITFDGLNSNFKAAELLGANLDYLSDQFKTSIEHPVTNEKVYIVFDACHAMKCLRNLFKFYKVLKDKNGQEIKWEFIEKLHNLQEQCGLRAANKLTNSHVHFEKDKMKTRLCLQTLSNSVSIGVAVCRELEIPGFELSEPTESFLAIADKMFDLLNTKPFGRGRNATLSGNNVHAWSKLLTECADYISLLTVYEKGKEVLVLKSRRKTAVAGLLVTLTSLNTIMHDLVLVPGTSLKFLATFRLSQDALELFFSSLRAKFGSNNNPNVVQLRSALRSIVCMKTKSINSGNCQDQEDIRSRISPLGPLHAVLEDKETNIHDIEGLSIDEAMEMIDDIDEEVSSFVCNIVAYIAGFVGRRLCINLQCAVCICKLHPTDEDIEKMANEFTLILRRSGGGLFFPSVDLFSVCKITEQLIKEFQPHGVYNLSKKSIVDCTIRLCNERGYFSSLHCEASHRIELTREIALDYLKVRFHHIAKQTTIKNNPTSNRRTCTKSVTFSGN